MKEAYRLNPAGRKRVYDKLSRGRPSKRERIEGTILYSESNILGGVGEFAVVEHASTRAALPFAVNPPMPCSVDCFSIDRNAICEAAQNSLFLGVKCAIGPQWKIQKQVAILAHDVDEHLDDCGGRFVSDVALVVPVAHTGIGLPRLFPDLVLNTSLVISHTHAIGELTAVVGLFAVVDCLQISTPPSKI